ncbi:transmembrane protein, putative [Medicago truncatula]|uniref:Transmembrane protein, putative n=1 Tax=Medicago truncatula TaxID=3880 RepID=A0A072UA36_MEDTR|nr:transmembrane protein, putative [Medicago truncatula]
MALMFVVFFVAIALSLVGNTYATRQGDAGETQTRELSKSSSIATYPFFRT